MQSNNVSLGSPLPPKLVCPPVNVNPFMRARVAPTVVAVTAGPLFAVRYPRRVVIAVEVAHVERQGSERKFKDSFL